MGRPANTVERMLSRDVEKTSTCWIWAGPRQANGYGKATILKRSLLAHRVFYEHYKGAIPDGFQVDHLCKNRLCVNPEHLEAVPPSVNNARSDSPSAVNARKTLCLRGHELAQAYVTPNGRRHCRVCRGIHQRKYQGVTFA